VWTAFYTSAPTKRASVAVLVGACRSNDAGFGTEEFAGA
jgi:hypothetical protein